MRSRSASTSLPSHTPSSPSPARLKATVPVIASDARCNFIFSLFMVRRGTQIHCCCAHHLTSFRRQSLNTRVRKPIIGVARTS
ncbi:hypothetical protein K438DRAFT_1810361 [Mycena galopus ATCC 62051]|nr:hypothetical protein K438DRAFT_1810361 [Mycena galopus ATCC 62051]